MLKKEERKTQPCSWMSACEHLQFDLTEEDEAKISQLIVPVPIDEKKRIRILRQTSTLDTQAEAEFDRYTRLASRYFQVPIALVSLVDVDRQWFKSRVGLDTTETHRDVAFCSYTVLESTSDVLIVHNALEDARFAENPLVLGKLNIRFYAGASIVVEGVKIGSFCLIDRVPRPDFSPDDANKLKDISQIVADLFSSRRRKVMEVENDLARLNMMVLDNIKTPLHALSSHLEEIKRQTNSPNYKDFLQTSVPSFKSKVNSLNKVIESGIELALTLTNENCIKPFEHICFNSSYDDADQELFSLSALQRHLQALLPRDVRSSKRMKWQTDRKKTVGMACDEQTKVLLPHLTLLEKLFPIVLQHHKQHWEEMTISSSIQSKRDLPDFNGFKPNSKSGKGPRRLFARDQDLYFYCLRLEVSRPLVQLLDQIVDESQDIVLTNVFQHIRGFYKHTFDDDLYSKKGGDTWEGPSFHDTNEEKESRSVVYLYFPIVLVAQPLAEVKQKAQRNGVVQNIYIICKSIGGCMRRKSKSDKFKEFKTYVGEDSLEQLLKKR